MSSMSTSNERVSYHSSVWALHFLIFCRCSLWFANFIPFLKEMLKRKNVFDPKSSNKKSSAKAKLTVSATFSDSFINPIPFELINLCLIIKMQYFLWSTLQFQSTTYIVTKPTSTSTELEHLQELLLEWNTYTNFYWNGTHARTSTELERLHKLLLNWNFYWIRISTNSTSFGTTT